MNLVSLLHERARLHPERPALIDRAKGRDRIVTFGELNRRVARGAARFRALGLARGRTLLVFQPVSIELYECLLAAFHAGLRVMLADPSAGKSFLTNCCDRLPPDAFFGSRKAQLLRFPVPALRRIPCAIASDGWFPGAHRWQHGQKTSELVPVDDDEPALITFTSGSTGLPKAAVRTHGFLMAQHRTLSRSLHFQDGEVDLITLPVFVLANLASGLTSVLADTNLAKPGEPNAAAIQAQCQRHGVTRCAASPSFFEGLLASPGGLPPFKKVFTGGAPVFNDLLRRLSATLPEAEIHSVYGSTEAEPIAHFPAPHLTQEIEAITLRGGGLCAGPPVAEITVRVIADRWGQPLGPFAEDELDELVMPVGESGEIVVAGDHVLSGYLDGVGDEETKIRAGSRVWHRTGDAGWFDAEGRLWLLGRAAERMENVGYPFAIECAVRASFPKLRVACLRWKDEAVLVVEQAATAAERQAIERQIAPLGIRRVIPIERLPLDRRHNAKIDYPELRKKLDAGQAVPRSN